MTAALTSSRSSQGEGTLAVLARHSLAVGSGVWLALKSVGSAVQRCISNAAQHSYEKQTAGNRLTSVPATMHRQKAAAMMSDKAIQAAIQSELVQTELVIGEAGPCVSRPMIQLVSASVNSAELLWSGFLNCLAQRLLSEEWKGILYLRRARCDETPLKIRTKAPVFGSELSPHAKILQSELSLFALVQNTTTKQHLLFFGSVPCPLKLLDRTTAEVTKAAVLADVMNVDDSALADRFQWRLRVATVDRYGANLKAERSILHDSVNSGVGSSGDADSEIVGSSGTGCLDSGTGVTGGGAWTKYTKACDLHIASQILLKTTALAERDISGLLSTSLSQQGAGVLQALQQCLQDVFRERLVLYYEAPPVGRIREHREQVVDLYLPLDIKRPSRTVLLRRYILAALFNGNYARHDVVEHYCVWGCCTDFDHTVKKFATFGVWSLLCAKCPRFPRSRWTNQPQSVAWGGLLAAVHNVLEPTIVKFTEPSKKPQQVQPQGAQSLFPGLPDLDHRPQLADEDDAVRNEHVEEDQAQFLDELGVEMNVADVEPGEAQSQCI